MLWGSVALGILPLLHLGMVSSWLLPLCLLSFSHKEGHQPYGVKDDLLYTASYPTATMTTLFPSTFIY